MSVGVLLGLTRDQGMVLVVRGWDRDRAVVVMDTGTTAVTVTIRDQVPEMGIEMGTEVVARDRDRDRGHQNQTGLGGLLSSIMVMASLLVSWRSPLGFWLCCSSWFRTW